MSESTTDQLFKWFKNTAFPTPKKDNLIVLPELPKFNLQAETPAFDLYALHYNNLKKGTRVISSAAVADLTKAVQNGQLAIELWTQVAKDDKDLEDKAGTIQLQIFRAANWLRRFTQERNTPSAWFDEQERKEEHELAQSIDEEAGSLINKLIEIDAQCKKRYDDNTNSWKATATALVQATEKNGLRTSYVTYLRAEVLSTRKMLKLQHKKMAFFLREVEDCVGVLDKSQEEVVVEARKLIRRIARPEEVEPPKWRVLGITTLGPFGVRPIYAVDSHGKEVTSKPEIFMATSTWDNVLTEKVLKDEKLIDAALADNKPGCYVLVGDKVGKYDIMGQGPNKTVSGLLSPLAKITIKIGPTHKLIRIPVDAKFFCWAYPVILTNYKIPDAVPTPMDAFLYFGGYVYFDKHMKVIQCNAITVQGSQLQFSSPAQLPKAITEELDHNNRFAEITFPSLLEKGATHFAWLNPGEFSDEKKFGEHHIPPSPGGFAYKYSDSDKNNYFLLSSIEQTSGAAGALKVRVCFETCLLIEKQKK